MKVSILMPTYNDENLIASSIKSLINETYTNCELLIMDDGASIYSLFFCKVNGIEPMGWPPMSWSNFPTGA